MARSLLASRALVASSKKNEHWILINYPCNKDALSLPLTDTLPILSYHRVISQRQGFDVVGDVCHTGCMADAFDAGLIVRYGNVSRNGVGEQVALLHYSSTLASPPFEIVFI